MDVVGWIKSTHKKKKTHTQTLNPNKIYISFGFSLLSSPSRVLVTRVLFGPSARERKRKRKGALYDDDVNDDEYVLRDDDDDAKNRPAIYAPRADDASSQSAPEVYSGGDGGGAFR